MGQKYTTTEISNSFALWSEYVDPDGTMTEEEFESLSEQEKNKMQKQMFPNECDDVDQNGNQTN